MPSCSGRAVDAGARPTPDAESKSGGARRRAAARRDSVGSSPNPIPHHRYPPEEEEGRGSASEGGDRGAR